MFTCCIYAYTSCLFSACISCIWTTLWVPVGTTYFSALFCRLGGMFYEVKGPIPRPKLTYRIPRIEWIVMTPTECQVLLIAIMRPTTSRGSNGIPSLACICNDDGVSGELLTLVTFLTYHILDPTCERGWEILFCRKTSLHPTLCPFRLSIIINVEPLNLGGLTLCGLCKVIYHNQHRTSESGGFDLM